MNTYINVSQLFLISEKTSSISYDHQSSSLEVTGFIHFNTEEASVRQLIEYF